MKVQASVVILIRSLAVSIALSDYIMFVRKTPVKLGVVCIKTICVETWSYCTTVFINYLSAHIGPWGCGSDFKNVIPKHKLQINFMSTSCKSALRWMPLNTLMTSQHWLGAFRQPAIPWTNIYSDLYYHMIITRPQTVSTVIQLWSF